MKKFSELTKLKILISMATEQGRLKDHCDTRWDPTGHSDIPKGHYDVTTVERDSANTGCLHETLAQPYISIGQGETESERQ